MAEVTAVRQVQSEEFVAWFHRCHKHSHICLCARMRLHVGILGAEDFLHALDGKRFRLIDHLTSAIVAVAGIAFCILVCEARPHGAHHLVADKVFRGNQLYAFLLALMFALDDVENQIVSFHIGLI